MTNTMNSLKIRDQGIVPGRRFAETSVDKLQQAIDDIRSLDNSEVDLDPASDRVLLSSKRWWQPWKSEKLVEYTVRPEGEYGFRKVSINSAENPGFAEIQEFKLNGCNVGKKEWVDRDNYWMNTDYRHKDVEPLVLHQRAAGPIGLNKAVHQSPGEERSEADRLVSDSPLLTVTVNQPETKLSEWVKGLRKSKPRTGFEAPVHQPLQDLICSIEDTQTLEQRLQKVALKEHKIFGGQYAVESNGKAKLVKRGDLESSRSHYRKVQRYWKSLGQNHTGLERDKDWSGAFLNYTMEKVGLDSPLRQGETAFFQQVVNYHGADGHRIESTSKAKPQLGNLLVHSKNGRIDLRYNPEEIVPGLELITRVEPGYIEVTSGDYEDSITTRRLELDGNGKVLNQDRYFALIDLNLELDK